MRTNHRELHQAIDRLSDAQAARVTDFIASLLVEDPEPESDQAGDAGPHNGRQAAGWIERRMVGKWGPYEYRCWYGPDGKKHAEYRGKVKR